jgi:hypothetical protein
MNPPLGARREAALHTRLLAARDRAVHWTALPFAGPFGRCAHGAGPPMGGAIEPIIVPLRAAFEAERLQALEA